MRPSADPSRPAVLLLGAFERDNFGDGLFLLVTERLLGGAACTPASVLSADMDAVLGRRVVSVSSALARQPWDLVWVVGGEIGGVTVRDALPMSLPEPLGSRYEALPDEARRSYDTLVTGLDTDAPAYLPELTESQRASGTRVVVHSVGLTGAADHTGAVRGRAAAALGAADAVTVRERASAAAVERAGLRARLAPDVVHALPRLFPGLRRSDRTGGGDLVFQMNRGMFQAHDVHEIAAVLAGIAAEHDLAVVLLPAGTARHHDSPEQYQTLVQALAERAPELPVRMPEDRDPLALAAVVADASLWVGSSLHGRIVASAHHVPRVSLQVDKVSTYAHTWLDGMPFDVALSDVPSASREALARHGDAAGRAVDAALTDAAHTTAVRRAEEALRDR